MDIHNKLCNMCGHSRPLDQFYRNSHSKDGYLTRCKSCHSKVTAQLREQRKANYTPPPEDYEKRCHKCDEIKKARDFPVDRSKKDGLFEWCIACRTAYREVWYENGGRKYAQEWHNTWYTNNAETAKKRSTDRHRKLRYEALFAYSNGEMSCRCCSEAEIKFLAIDHINGGGKQHLKEIGSSNIYHWAKKNGYPPGFQVLCHNCNLAKGFYGECPHVKSRSSDPHPAPAG